MRSLGRLPYWRKEYFFGKRMITRSWRYAAPARRWIGGGGGNRTPVRRSSVKYDYMLSRYFDLAP